MYLTGLEEPLTIYIRNKKEALGDKTMKQTITQHGSLQWLKESGNCPGCGNCTPDKIRKVEPEGRFWSWLSIFNPDKYKCEICGCQWEVKR